MRLGTTITATTADRVPAACADDEVPATLPGSSGVLFGNTNIPRLKPPTNQIYLMAFNGGDSGPVYWHWIAGIGTPEAIHYRVLSDKYNEVKGKPYRLRTVKIGDPHRNLAIPRPPCRRTVRRPHRRDHPLRPLPRHRSIHGDNQEADTHVAVALTQADAAR